MRVVVGPQRIIQKYEREAKERNRDSWCAPHCSQDGRGSVACAARRYFAYIMDTSEEERAKGKTVEVCAPQGGGSVEVRSGWALPLAGRQGAL